MIRTERREGAEWIFLDRPEVKNALSTALVERLDGAVARALRDDGVRSIVITGAGDVFSAGADLNEMKSMRDAPFEENVASALPLFEFFLTLTRAAKPVVARVNGPAIAGALGLVAACDVAVAVAGLRFAFTEARLGIVPAMISPFIVRRIGVSRTQRLFLTAERFSSEDAERFGLVDRIVPADRLDETVDGVCRELALGAPGALTEVKRLTSRIAHGSPEEHRHYTAELIARLRAGDEGQEGMAAFLEKRKPRWAK